MAVVVTVHVTMKPLAIMSLETVTVPTAGQAAHVHNVRHIPVRVGCAYVKVLSFLFVNDLI